MKPWPPVGAGLVSAPPQERWRGSVLGFGAYECPPGSELRLCVYLAEYFHPKRFRLTADGPGVLTNVVIGNRIQYQPYHSLLPQETFNEDGVNDELLPMHPGVEAEVRIWNPTKETRRGSAWFEGTR